MENIEKLKNIFPDKFQKLAAVDIALVEEISERIAEIRSKVDAMIEARKVANKIECEYEKAKAYHEIAESLFDIRKPIDKLEEVVDNDMWPLPKYRELLFIS